jgi:hypothetical protein
MTKLQKIFKTQPDAFGFENEIEISVSYEPETQTIDNLQANCYSWRKGVFIDITDIFEASPFSKIADDIDWTKIYRDQMQEKAGIEALNAELDNGEMVYGEGFDPNSILETFSKITNDYKIMNGI